MKRLSIFAALPLVVVAGLFQACSDSVVVVPGEVLPWDGGKTDSGGTVRPPMGDGGTEDPEAGKDSGVKKDSGIKDSGGDTGVIQTSPGTQLLADSTASIYGSTTDGYVVYERGSGAATSLEVIGATGPATVIAATLGATDNFMIVGKAVALWTNVDNATGIATGLSVWTAAGGLRAVPTATASLDQVFAVSEDGTHFLFSLNATATLTDVSIGNSADGTVLKLMATAGNYNTCSPEIAFSKAIAFLQSCTGATGTTATLRSADSAVAIPTIHSLGTAGVPGSFRANKNATKAFWVKNTNNVGTVSNSDGSGTASTILTNLASGALNDDGSKVLFTTVAGALSTSATTNNPTVTALAPVAQQILDVSPDFAYAVVNLLAVDQTTKPDIPRADLNFASTATPGTPTALATGLPVGFSSTSSHFFYTKDLPAMGKTPFGTLMAHAAAGGVDKVISQGAVFPVLVEGSAKVVFDTNPQQSDMTVVFDIQVADASGGAGAVNVVQGADPYFEVRNGNLFYVSPGNGLYVVPLP